MGCIGIGTDTGFQLYSMSKPNERSRKKNKNGPCCKKKQQFFVRNSKLTNEQQRIQKKKSFSREVCLSYQPLALCCVTAEL
jgi:hypothetical protein